MCGIHGFITGKTREINADDFMRQGFVAGSLRGMDSSGIATIDCRSVDGEIVDYHKLPINGTHFVGDTRANNMIREASNTKSISIGHTRAATVGSVKWSTAHPFYYYDETAQREFVGVHNGTLTNWQSKPGAKGCTVDSEWALGHIMDEQYDAFENFTGAYCFLWYDSATPGVLNIARNTERTMFVAFTESGNMACASEAGMLMWLLERNKTKIKGDVREIEAGYWYQFDMENLAEPKKIKLPAAKVASYNYNNRSTTTTTYDNSTHVQKVDALLAKVRKAVTTAAAKTEEVVDAVVKGSVVSAVERAAAHDLHMLGMKGSFVPTHVDNHTSNIYGLLTIPGRDLDASFQVEGIMRDASKVYWEVDTVFEVNVLGLIDDTKEITALVSKPRVVAVADTVH